MCQVNLFVFSLGLGACGVHIERKGWSSVLLCVLLNLCEFTMSKRDHRDIMYLSGTHIPNAVGVGRSCKADCVPQPNGVNTANTGAMSSGQKSPVRTLYVARK